MNLQNLGRFAVSLLFVICSSNIFCGALVPGSEPHGATGTIPDRSLWPSATSNESYLSRLATEANDALLKGQDDLGISLCTRALPIKPIQNFQLRQREALAL